MTQLSEVYQSNGYHYRKITLQVGLTTTTTKKHQQLYVIQPAANGHLLPLEIHQCLAQQFPMLIVTAFVH